MNGRYKKFHACFAARWNHFNNSSATCEMIYQVTNQAKQQQLTHQQKSEANTNNRRFRLPRKLLCFVSFRCYRSRFRDVELEQGNVFGVIRR